MAEPRRNLPEDDDGRTIARMNVEGMPWYTPESPDSTTRGENTPEPMAPEDRRHYIFGALLAALAIAAVFGVVYLLFILFCQHVWFR